MKKLILVRHAKSSWSNANIDDHDRVLNDRGKHDAPIMAERLHEQLKNIDALISSSATRAMETARYFAKAFDIKPKDIIIEPRLYLAEPDVFQQVIASLDKDLKKVAIFSHNPGITYFVNRLTDVHIDDMPTCAMFGVKADIEEWSAFEQADKQFWFFDYPKNV